MNESLKECEVIASASLSPRRLQLPFYSTRVAAGFPSPAEDHLGDTLDLNALLVRRPAATFFVRVRGESMIGAGIYDGDILVVDRSLRASSGQIIVAALDGELTVKTYKREGTRVQLLPENPDYPPIEIGELQSFEVWGVVSGVVRETVRGGQCTRSWT